MSLQKFLSSKTLRKVPEITMSFWVVKLLSTALGESTSDFLVHTIDPVYAVIFGAILFAVAIGIQFWAKKYVHWIYWLTVTSVAIFGTMAADIVHIVFGVAYQISSISFMIILTIIFVTWYKTEKTLSIHSINTRHREIFYWATVIATFALGTALGDTTAITFNLGYLLSGILFGILFLIPFILRKFNLSEVFTFWFSYVITRPLGASFADWFGRTKDLGGIGFGTAKTSLVLTGLIVLLVVYLSTTKKYISHTGS